MADPLNKVSRGDTVVFAAEGHNAMVDAARAERDRRFDGGARPPAPPRIVSGSSVLVRNGTGAAVDRFGVLTLGPPVYGPSDNLASFLREPCLGGYAPGTYPNFVILQEPLAVGAIGVGMVSGITPAILTVDADQEDLRFADLETGTGSLVLVDSGHAEVIWRQSGTGTVWALVRLGNSNADLVGA